MNYLYRLLAGRSIRQTLNGRNRNNKEPEKGRFNASDTNAIAERTWAYYDSLVPNAPKLKTLGNRYIMDSAVFSLALYRAVKEKTEDNEYATELAGDIIWKGYKASVVRSVTMARLFYRDRRKQLNFICQTATKRRYSPPAYDVKARFENDTFYMDYYRCPIFNYFQEQGEDELLFFRNTWCMMDWAIIEELIKGPVRYERTQTLSAGDNVCDMKWIVLEE